MIEVKDRVSAKPNRILITPENGEKPFYATWERADEPIEKGTPINKLLFDSIDEGGVYLSGLDDLEITTKKVTVGADWTQVKFDKPLSGVPKVFLSVSNSYVAAVKNVTDTGCSVALFEQSFISGYVAKSSGGEATTRVSMVGGMTFVEGDVDVMAVYDGGINL